MELTSKQIEVIKKYWKKGHFVPSNLRTIYSTESARKECIERLYEFGIIYEDNFTFKINRERFLELQEE